VYLLFAIVTLAGLCAWAQAAPPQPPADAFYWQAADTSAAKPDVIFRTGKAGDHAFGTARFFAVTDDAKMVTGAPYSATATTETTQVLADGNRIVNRTTAFLARDSEGRTRREENMDAAGPLAINGPKMVFIHDPVSKASYILDLNDRTAHVVKPMSNSAGPASGKPIVIASNSAMDGNAADKPPLPPPPPGGMGVENQVMARGGPEAGVEQRIMVFDPRGDDAETKTESLGTQVIEGVVAEGKRVTRTIPAGQIGNERPLEITSEVWTSPELQMIVLSKHNDPRFGETVYKLTNIQREEPDHSLFTVPSNFAVH
jgi:hypothetical protein